MGANRSFRNLLPCSTCFSRAPTLARIGASTQSPTCQPAQTIAALLSCGVTFVRSRSEPS